MSPALTEEEKEWEHSSTYDTCKATCIGTVVDSLPPLLTVLVEICFSTVSRGVAYDVRGHRILNCHGGH